MPKYFPYFFITLFLLSMTSCNPSAGPEQNNSNPDTNAKKIIDKSLEQTHVRLLENSRITFEFRNQKVSYSRQKDRFEYTRTFVDTTGNEVSDTLTNARFSRHINGTKLTLSDIQSTNLSGGINSIIYFAFLPYRLHDPAVISEYAGMVYVKDKPYHKIKITFKEDGGGEDHDDTFYYYFDEKTYDLDYLAYSYHTDGGGIRFREAYNRRSVKGIIINDYINYKGLPDSVNFDEIETYYNSGQLKELSRIELKNIKIIE